MNDSTSDNSHDEIKPAFYKITSEEMLMMKHNLEAMKSRLGAHLDPVLQEFEALKASIAEAEPASENLITPESSDSGSVLDSDRPAPETDPFLLRSGIRVVASHMIDQLDAQKNETSTRIADFIDSWDPYDDGILSVVNEAMSADPNFIQEFEIRARKIISDFFIRKMKDALVKELTEAFSKI
ncbi:hypothetical protein KCU81_g9879, partial [Aureobasidium melanogenum]|uniref:Uncharacterized protein n=1 Tax=Aureobasidium melanogenum (strain CBS 110374) TaxID=1043003 RepID=A0A074VT20_AURM1